MPGLPRAKDETRPRETFSILVLDSVERLTIALRRGDAFTAQGLADMQALSRRLGAFQSALNDRLSVLEDGDELD